MVYKSPKEISLIKHDVCILFNLVLLGVVVAVSVEPHQTSHSQANKLYNRASGVGCQV